MLSALRRTEDGHEDAGPDAMPLRVVRNTAVAVAETQ